MALTLRPDSPRREAVARRNSAPVESRAVVPARIESSSNEHASQDTWTPGDDDEQERRFTCPRCGYQGGESGTQQEASMHPALAHEIQALTAERVRVSVDSPRTPA